MEFKINTDKIVDNVVSEALEREIDGKTIKQWMTEIAEHRWISVKDKLPEKSAQVLTLSHAGVISTHDYSAKWKSFNSHDFLDKEANKRVNVNKYVAYWLPISVLPKPPKEADA